MKKAVFITLMVSTICSTLALAQKSMDVDTRVQGDKKIIKIRQGEDILNSKLNLTDEQKKEFKKLDLAFQKETLSLKNELGVKKLELDVELEETNPDLKKINSLIDDIHTLQASIEKKRIAGEFKKRNLLTDEQKKNWRPRGFGMQKEILMLEEDEPLDFMWFGDEPPARIERRAEIQEEKSERKRSASGKDE
ncbi:periplasmic heavy metal sensor [candidate division KSB1 bacterium]|nr:periplasmic heavy metal sensor [candidate division KSB1 bacterium]